VCSPSFPQVFIPTVEHLYIYENEYFFNRPRSQDDIENSQWLEVLHPFTALKDLHVSRGFLPRIAPVFQDLVGERVTEGLPVLQSIFLEDLDPSGSVSREPSESLLPCDSLPVTLWLSLTGRENETSGWREMIDRYSLHPLPITSGIIYLSTPVFLSVHCRAPET
jgi:hypothetical protein